MEQKKARIFYASTPYPTTDKYWGDESIKEIGLSKEFFNEHWKELPIAETINDDSESSLESLFAKYNDYDANPLSHQNGGQGIVKQLGVHTSMSIEDIIEVGGIFYMVFGVGFKRIVWKD